MHLMFKVHLRSIKIACVCVCFQMYFNCEAPTSFESSLRIMLSVQMKLLPIMCLGDRGLKQWSGQQTDLEVWSLRSFHLTQVGFVRANRFLRSTPGSARVSLRKPREVYRLPFNLFFCEMRVGVNLRGERLAVWLELSCVREC